MQQNQHERTSSSNASTQSIQNVRKNSRLAGSVPPHDSIVSAIKGTVWQPDDPLCQSNSTLPIVRADESDDQSTPTAYSADRSHAHTRNPQSDVIEKFDSACSKCVSGAPGRLVTVLPGSDPRYRSQIQGFNGTRSSVTLAGRNRDDMIEYYIQDMPSNLCLLCANDYAKQGAAILFADDGVVLRLHEEQLHRLRTLVQSLPATKQLTVRNGTYEVIPDSPDCQAMNITLFSPQPVPPIPAPQTTVIYDDNHDDGTNTLWPDGVDAVVYSSTSTKYFNTRVHVSNVDERILAYLIAGFTIPMLKSYVEKGLIVGLHPSVTMHSINAFARRYGNTPDPFALAYPFPYGGERGGYLATPMPITAPGQWVQADFFEPDYSGRDVMSADRVSSSDKERRKKIVAFGGAKYGFLTIDKHTGYIYGLLTKTTGDQLPVLKKLVAHYQLHNQPIKLLSADSGVIPSKMFRVLSTDVQQYLEESGIKIRVSEPFNHQNGTPDVEKAIRDIKELMTKAIGYILSNPNFALLGFTRTHIFKLWGELMNWAILVHNLHMCKSKPDCTRHEAFTGEKPDVLAFRMLPIFAVLHVQRVPHTADEAPDDTNRSYWQRGLYVGPDLQIKGAIRVAVLTQHKRLTIIRTTKFKQISDGGDANIHAHVQRGLSLLSTYDDTVVELLSDDESIAPDNPPNIQPPPNLVTTTTPNPSTTHQPVTHTPPIVNPHIDPPPVPTNNPLPPSSSPVDLPRGNKRKKTKKASAPVQQPTVVSAGPVQQQLDSQPVRHATSPEPPTQPPAPAPKRRQVRRYTDQIQDILNNMRRPNSRYVHDALSSNVLCDTYTELADVYTAHGVTVSTPASLADDGITEHDDSDFAHEDPLGPFDLPVESACTVSFTDWTTHKDDDWYYSPLGDIVQVSNAPSEDHTVETCYRAVTENVPKSFEAALRHPLWGDAARKEWATIIDAGTLMKIDKLTANELRKEGADMVVLFPVFEHKIKEGRDVYKVRLVANGRGHSPNESVYSATPRRQELLILLHLAASNNWSICHVDEVRAFLSAKYKGSKPVITRLVSSSELYRVVGALYGLRSSPKDYQVDVAARLSEMGFTRLPLCTCIYTKEVDGETLIVYDYVDDFICTGSAIQAHIQDNFVTPFRGLATTTDPVWNPELLLGMEIVRDLSRRTILLTMKKRIEDVVKLVSSTCDIKERRVPMPPSRYIVSDEDLDEMPTPLRDTLTLEQQKLYMAIVGSLIWISGVRHDILFSTTYLSWFTQKPRVHHLHMAQHVVCFLNSTKEAPLVLGGPSPIQPVEYTDSSLGTGPKRRSISGGLLKLHEDAGAIYALAKATVGNRLNTFESELDAAATGFKELAYIRNMLTCLHYKHYDSSAPFHLYCDNLAMVNFVKGEATATGARYMDIRLFYVREQYMQQRATIHHMSGELIPANILTKLGNADQHREFMTNILGHKLLTIPPIDLPIASATTKEV